MSILTPTTPGNVKACGALTPFSASFAFPIIGTVNPSTSTKGETGQLYIVLGVSAYVCVGRDSTGYLWQTSPAAGAGTFTSVVINPGDLTVTAGDIIVTAGDITATAGTCTFGTLVAAGTTVTTLTASGNTAVLGTFTTTGTTSLVSTGTAAVNIGNATAGIITILNNAAITIDSSAAIEINSTGGALSIGNDAVNQAVNIGTAGTRTITIGSATATLVYRGAFSINASVNANTNINTGTSTGTATIGNALATVVVAGASSINASVNANTNINTGTSTGTVTVGNALATVAVAGAVTINASVNANTAINTGTSTGTITIGNVANSGAILMTGASTITLASAGNLLIDSTAADIEIGTNAVAQNVQVGTGAAAKAVTLGSTNTTSSTTVNAGSGGITLNAAGLIDAVAATNSAAGNTVVVNAQVFSATFTGLTTGAGVSAQLTITNSTVVATSGVSLSLIRVSSAADVKLTIDGIKTVAGSIVIDYTNNGAAALDSNIIVSGWVLN